MDKEKEVFYYFTCMNDNYGQPALPKRDTKRITEGVIRGLYKFSTLQGGKHKVRLLSSGSIMQETLRAAELLHQDYDVTVEVWSAPSFNELTRDAQDVERYNHLNPTKKPRQSYIAECLNGDKSPIVAATDYTRKYVGQVSSYIEAPYYCLGTDGYGRSDSRANLRDFFEVSSRHIAYYALLGLYRKGKFSQAQLKKALSKLNIEQDRPYPLFV